MRRAYKYRLFTTANQERELAIMLESQRRLYNRCLEMRHDIYRDETRSISYGEQSAWFKAERAVNPYFARLNFSSAQATMRRLDKSFQAFFRRLKAGEKAGYPRFKARDRFGSVEFPAYGDGIRLNDSRLRVQHVGTIKVKVHRPYEGVVKTATLVREGGKWFVVLSCDLGDVAVAPSTNPPVGIDVGLMHFLTTDRGEVVANPRYLRLELPALRRLSRSLSRKKRSSTGRKKARAAVSRAHARIVNLRCEHHHKTALDLVRRYGLVALECLNIRGMLRNRRFARAISDAGWASFANILVSKAESAGVRVVKVDPRGTSQLCSACGATVRKDLSVRVHQCGCGLVLDRDTNAARNILARALAGTLPGEPNVDVGLHVLRSPGLQAGE